MTFEEWAEQRGLTDRDYGYGLAYLAYQAGREAMRIEVLQGMHEWVNWIEKMKELK